ncbi:MAG: SDR family oxidoreductase [Desulfobacterales bacterium]|nr:SDR family oxidoreductase [Desulfobacterales bacterium]MDX2511118.1 SDR family oxidoreductase [Desulfobacterales bacterium]
MSKLNQKVVIITGASSGIGEATARKLAENGAHVMLTARRKDRLTQLQEAIASAGGKAVYCQADITRAEEVTEVAEQTLSAFGRIDAIFNNAGIMPLSMIDKLHVGEWEQMVDVNIKGVLYGIAAVLPHMLERGEGHIINVSSVAGHVIFPGASVYCGTKFAVRAITEGLRTDLRGKADIRVSLISPGAVSTELSHTITDPDILATFKTSGVTPLSAESIANAVRYVLEQPADVDVNEIIVRPVSQPR